MRLRLRATLVEHVADANPSIRWQGRWLEVFDTRREQPKNLAKRCLEQYRWMCEAIVSDIQTAEGSGQDFLEGLRRIEQGEAEHIQADGNAWIAHITQKKVWFEGLHDQGKGGAVTFDQFKLAVETYVRFLADPEGKTIEVPFPADQ